MNSTRSSERAANEVRTHPEFDRELLKFAKRNPVGAERLSKGLRRFVETGAGDIERVKGEPILSRLKVAPGLPRVFLASKGGITYLLGLEKRKIAYTSRVLERMIKRAGGLGVRQ